MTGYLYILKHGIGPGTIPNDVTILKEKDLPNYYTAVWLDRFLTTSELKQYDIPSETRINELLDRIDYCQVDNGDDVVPCDEVLASSYIKSAREPKWWGSTYSCHVVDAYNKGELTYKNMEEWETEYNGGFKPSNMGTKGILDYYIKTGKDPRDDVEACGDIKASIMPKPTVDSVLKLIDDNKIVFKNDVAYWNRGKGVLPREYRDCIAQTEYAHWINEWSCEQAEKYGSRAYYDYDGETDVDACNNITASKIVASKMSDIDLLAREALECTTKDELSAVISGLDSLGLRKLYLHYMEMLRDDSLSVGYIASDLSDTLYNMFSNDHDDINASTKPMYFANTVSASEFDPFDDEYGIHRVSKSDLNYIRDSIYERISDVTDIKFSIDMAITKQLPDAIAKVHITLRNLDDGTILEYDDRVDSNNLEGTIQRLTKFAKALITENWSEYPDNLTAEDVERICEDIYDEIETTIFDYYLYGTPELMVLYDEEDPTFLYNIDTDYSDLADSLTFNIKLEALDRDDLEGLVENYLKPITSAYNTEYTIEHSNTGRTGKTGYIHIKFQ